MSDELYGHITPDGEMAVTRETSFEIDAEHIGSIEDGDIVVIRGEPMWPRKTLESLVVWFAEHGKRVQVLQIHQDQNIELLTEEAMEAMGWVRRA